MKQPLVSVVIPCFNQAHFLGDAIDTVMAQDYGPVEIIVVDDGSTDDTAEVAGRYTQVKLVQQANRGLASARNTGFDASRGSYLVFLDADDRLTPNALTAGVACLARHPDCAFASGRYRICSGHDAISALQARSKPPGDDYAALLRENHIAMHATVMYRRLPLEQTGKFDPRLQACEDYDLYLRIARRFSIVHHEHVVAEYRKHGGGMSADSLRMLSAALQVLAAQREYVDTRPEYETAYATGVRFWTRFYGVRSLARIARAFRASHFRDARQDSVRLIRCVGALNVVLGAPVWLVTHWLAHRAQESSR